MADIKTHLRELSFGFGIYKLLKEKNVNVESLSPQEFLKVCKDKIEGTSHLQLSSITKSKNKEKFTAMEKKIINNGIELAKEVISIQQITDKISSQNSQLKIKWLGKDTQSGKPWDIEINGIHFSLKEDSFILHNMGLYQLLNVLTGTNQFKRGLHVFEAFAMEELQNWFEITRDLAIESLKKRVNNRYIYENNTGTKKGILSYDENNDILRLEFTDKDETKVETITEFSKCDYCKFTNTTTSNVREHTFSKLIREDLEHNEIYEKAKNACSEAAGQNIIKFLNEENRLRKDLSSSSIQTFFRFYEETYYYAKISEKGNVEIYRVPAKKEIETKKLKIKEVTYGVPSSQLNIFTKVINEEKDDNEKLIVRNELRYSHGQLNGSPEAKMYIHKDSSLSVIYEEIKKVIKRNNS